MSGGTWEYKNKILDEIADYYEEKSKNTKNKVEFWLSKLSRTMDEIYKILDEIEAGDRDFKGSKEELKQLFATAEAILNLIRMTFL